jgi:hypothetical protein
MGKVASAGPNPDQRAAKSEARTAALIRQHLADDDRPPRPQEHGMRVWDLFQPLHNYFRW